jgi:hypothetical protein
MDLTRRQVAAVILVTSLSLLTVGIVAYVELPLATPKINFQVSNAGQLLENITVSCDSCVPGGATNHTWEGTLALGRALLDISDNASGSLAIQVGLAYSTPRVGNSPCPGYSTATSCITVLPNATLPFSVALNIHQTSSGGVLKVKVFRANGTWFEFQSATGQFSDDFNMQSVNGYEPV